MSIIDEMKKNNQYKKSNVWDSGMDFVTCGKVNVNFVIKLSVSVKAKIELLMKEFPSIEWLSYLLGEIDWEKNVATVTDLFIPEKQKISSTLVDEIDCLHNADIIGVIHSHHNMPPVFSGTDHEYINKNNHLSIVVAHSGSDAVVRYKTPCGSYTFIKPSIVTDYSTVVNESSFLAVVRNKIKKPIYNANIAYQKHIGNDKYDNIDEDSLIEWDETSLTDEMYELGLM